MMFEIARAGHLSNDSKGDVRIQITRTEKGQFVKGNVSKSITLKNTKVSDVYKWIDKQLRTPPKAKAKEETETV